MVKELLIMKLFIVKGGGLLFYEVGVEMES